ncbi:MAG: serine hydrolase [Gemmatimonadaceae bacterium]|nr:serine hydrolase [Gemmatimonadaceae bacterium]
MYLAAGQLAERITGCSWEALVRERIFAPLHMTSSQVSYREQFGAHGRAEPYELREHGLERVALRDIDNIAPAGSIGSTLEDMLKYVLMYLSEGRVAGQQVVPKAALDAIQTPRVLMGGDIAVAEMDWPELGPNMYALGLVKTHYRGHMMVTHSGGIDGYPSMMSWMPHEKLGIVVLTNSTSEASTIATYWLYDRLLGLTPIDWTTRFKAAEAAMKARTSAAPTSVALAVGTSRPATEYAGVYEHSGYGTVVIGASASGELSFTFDRMHTSLNHVSHDVFRADPSTRAWGIIPNLVSFTVSFRADAEGAIAELEIPFEPTVRPIVFTRKKSAE